MPDSFVWLGEGASAVGIPNAVLLMLILYGGYIVMSRMRSGGTSTPSVATSRRLPLSMPVQRESSSSPTWSARCWLVSAASSSRRNSSGSPTFSSMYELYVIAAVVVGETNLSGSESKMFSTLISAHHRGHQQWDEPDPSQAYTQKWCSGLVILGAVLLDKLRAASEPRCDEGAARRKRGAAAA
ncbi:MAG: hypothetical protein U0744_11065 [Gemmataceae bacterium]